MTTGKTIALTRQTFVGKVMSLLHTMLSKLVIAFLPESPSLSFSNVCHSFSWLNTPPASLRTQECFLKDVGATALKSHHQETKQGPHSSPDSKWQNFLNVMGCAQLPVGKGEISFWFRKPFGG